MAKAPTPGGREKAAKEAEETYVMRLTVKGETWDVPSPAALPIKERFAVRAATGLPIENFMGGESYGEDSFVIMWWLARRAGGEPALPFRRVWDEWELLKPDLDEDDVDLVLVNLSETAEVDSPEA